jgi:hypothetical protein
MIVMKKTGENMESYRTQERGQILLIMAIGITVLLGFAALTIDQGNAHIIRRQAQNAADQAALAGALAKYSGEDCAAIAVARVADNGYAISDDVDVQVDCTFGENDEYIQVLVTTTTNTFLAGFIGHNATTSTVEAVARFSTGEGGNSGPFTGTALMALKPTGKSTFNISGNANLTTVGGGIFTNSDNAKAFNGGGNLTYTTTTGINIVGGADISGNVTINSKITAGGPVSLSGNADVNGTIKQNTPVAAIAFPPPELVIAPPVVNAPVCSGNGSMTTSGNVVRLTPGNHSSGRSVSGNYANIIFEPGNYCFGGNLTIDGNFTVTANNINIHMASNKNFYLNGNMTFNGANSLFYLHSGNFTLNGNAVVSIPSSTVYIETGDFNLSGNSKLANNSTGSSLFYLGTGDLDINGNNTFTSSNTVYYLNSGSMKWNGNAKLVMDAPDTGDYAGLLIYLPPSNTSALTINGNANSVFTGSIIAPGSAVKINGNSNTTSFHSRIIGYTIDFIGNSNTTIHFMDDEQFDITTGDGPFIELTK